MVHGVEKAAPTPPTLVLPFGRVPSAVQRVNTLLDRRVDGLILTAESLSA